MQQQQTFVSIYLKYCLQLILIYKFENIDLIQPLFI